MTARAIIVGAPRSGSGKTSVAIGLMRALRRRGLAVRGAKSGPDYIDPAFHEAATGRPGVNLDSWAMRPALLEALAADIAQDADIVVIESAMGLFDGIPAGPGRSGAASDLARLYGLPVLLVLDVSGQSQTAAAIARGFAVHDPAVRIAGVVLNRVASDRHRTLAADAITATGLPVAGSIPRDSALAMPERHLGLVQASEHRNIDSHIDRLADAMEGALDVDAILAMAMPFAPGRGAHEIAIPVPGRRIALARDAAFTFLYPHLLAQWQAAGAQIVPFSPLADEAPAMDCDVCWLPGGYPELHADALASARRFRAGMRAFAESRPVHGECGGFMVLGTTLEDAQGAVHPMLGLLGHATSFAKRKMNLGYRQARFAADTPAGRNGQTVRGHEFHYAVVTEKGADEPLGEIADGQGRVIGPFGARRGNVTGTFFHAIATDLP
jgi:cobyrinic acid a,c-diamide synthase